MALPKDLRLKGHRTFDHINKNSRKFHGKLMTIKVAKSNPNILLSHKNKSNIFNLKVAITISKKVSKKSVVRNKIRRLLHRNFLKNFKKENNHTPYWLLVNLKGGDFFNYEEELLKEFELLINKIGLMQ